jgi:hypothetical protein
MVVDVDERGDVAVAHGAILLPRRGSEDVEDGGLGILGVERRFTRIRDEGVGLQQPERALADPTRTRSGLRDEGAGS